jgi:hypothetical protein
MNTVHGENRFTDRPVVPRVPQARNNSGKVPGWRELRIKPSRTTTNNASDHTAAFTGMEIDKS